MDVAPNSNIVMPEPELSLELIPGLFPSPLLSRVLLVQQPHLVADGGTFPVLILDLALQVAAVLLLVLQLIQNLNKIKGGTDFF